MFKCFFLCCLERTMITSVILMFLKIDFFISVTFITLSSILEQRTISSVHFFILFFLVASWLHHTRQRNTFSLCFTSHNQSVFDSDSYSMLSLFIHQSIETESSWKAFESFRASSRLIRLEVTFLFHPQLLQISTKNK
jgi:hypothetical protein